MAIDFRCTQCGRMLRVPDETAGRQAQCPACQAVLPIPAAGGQPAAGGDEGLAETQPWSGGAADWSPPSGGGPPEQLGQGYAPINPPPQPPYEGGAAGPPGGYPPSGGYLPSGDPANPYLAPTYVPPPSYYAPGQRVWVPTSIDIGDVVSRAWQIYSNRFGLCMLATVGVLIQYAFQGMLAVMQSLVERVADWQVVLSANLLANVASTCFNVWIGIGVNLLLLKVARGEEAGFADLFSGGHYFFRTLGSSIVFGVMVMVGLVLCIVPGVLLALMFAPYYLVIVDRDCRAIESLDYARQLTRGNLLAIFLAWLVSMALIFCGILACGVGVFFAIPLVGMIWVVAYLGMSGQSTFLGPVSWQAAAQPAPEQPWPAPGS